MTLAEPVLKLLEFINTQNLPASKRAEYYILGAKILTNAADNIDKAIIILNTIEDLIFEIPDDVKIFNIPKNYSYYFVVNLFLRILGKRSRSIRISKMAKYSIKR